MYKILIYFLLVLNLAPNADGKQEDLGNRLDKVISASGLARSDFGLAVSPVNGENVYQLNANKRMSPASLSKIPTAIAALESLAPNYEFSTQVWSTGKIENGVLDGNLYLKGLGEPALISERMWYLVNAFIRNEIKSVTGDLIVDESYFDAIRSDKDRLPPSEGRAFDAPVSALSFNWNSVNVFIRPGNKVGDAAKVFVDPINDYILEVTNNVRTVARGQNAIEVKPKPVIKNGDVIGDKLVVSGTIAVDSKEIVKYRSISEPDVWTGRNFIDFLRQRGVVVKGRVKKGRVPDGAAMLVAEPGNNARQAVIDMMKFSNNFIAEMLTKHLAVNAGANQGSLEQGLKVIYKLMGKAGIPASEYGFASPSGLSRLNQMSANHFIKLLKYGGTFAYAPEFWSSFPISSKDGTIKSRMKGLDVRAKTGLLSGASGLSGMVLRPDGNHYLFAFIYNGDKSFEARDVFDRLCAELAKN